MCGSKSCHTRSILGGVEYHCTDCGHVDFDVDLYEDSAVHNSSKTSDNKKDLYNSIYDILVAEAGASERGREHFIRSFMDDAPREYRFQGALGFGGKFWRQPFRISCYAEDETPERIAMIDRVNGMLKDLEESS